MPLRPQNKCLTCGSTWYPRGKDTSTRCPNCGVLLVYVDSPSPSGSVLGGCLGWVLIVGGGLGAVYGLLVFIGLFTSGHDRQAVKPQEVQIDPGQEEVPPAQQDPTPKPSTPQPELDETGKSAVKPTPRTYEVVDVWRSSLRLRGQRVRIHGYMELSPLTAAYATATMYETIGGAHLGTCIFDCQRSTLTVSLMERIRDKFDGSATGFVTIEATVRQTGSDGRVSLIDGEIIDGDELAGLRKDWREALSKPEKTAKKDASKVAQKAKKKVETPVMPKDRVEYTAINLWREGNRSKGQLVRVTGSARVERRDNRYVVAYLNETGRRMVLAFIPLDDGKPLSEHHDDLPCTLKVSLDGQVVSADGGTVTIKDGKVTQAEK